MGFIQNHDQIANTSRGKRLATLVSAGQQKLVAVFTLCSPFLPLLFMGEEYGETAPFLYFTSFDDPDLAAAVTEGRKRELGTHYSESEFANPQASDTFERCKLDWSKIAISPHHEILGLYRDLISLRKLHPALANCRKDLTQIQFDEQARWLVMKRADPSGSEALLVCNFSSEAQSIPAAGGAHPWRLALWTGDAIYDGRSGSYLVEQPVPLSHLSLAGFEAAIFSTVTPSANSAVRTRCGCRCLIWLTLSNRVSRAARGQPWHMINLKNMPNNRCFLTPTGSESNLACL